jgi:drug/metabolite transporter (DMT)-like permease
VKHLQGGTRTDPRGAIFVMAAASCYALSVVFAKGAYALGVSVQTLTVWRFALGAFFFWAAVAIRRPAWLSRRVVLTAIGMGAFGFAVQALTYFGAIAVMDAGMATLLVYTYPAIITVIGFVTRRQSPTRRTLAALACSGVGMLLLLGLGGLASVSRLGVVLALSAAVTYALYTMVASSLPAETDVALLMAIVTTSALVSVTVVAVASGAPLSLGGDPAAYGWVLTYIVVGTLIAMTLHTSGLVRIDASTAGILSSIEPLVAAAAVALVYGERMTLVQIIGGAAILAGVVVLQVRTRTRALGQEGRTEAVRPDVQETPSPIGLAAG